MKKKVLVLGGGLLQIPLLEMARKKGFEVLLSDYYPDPPGKRYCDNSRQISTFSIDENYQFALEEKVDWIVTIGTDQPVLTAAAVSERLRLPHPITEEQGMFVTNKRFMKARMAEAGIPTPGFRVYSAFAEADLQGLSYPLVMKPVDSQGQRGIFLLSGKESRGELQQMFTVSQQLSLTQSVIFEEFYPGEEITVNTWVKDGQAYNLLITDRLHYNDTEALGVCKQQRFPSHSAAGYEREIDWVVQQLVNAFKIQHGPLYIQLIIGKEGVKVVEFGYRIGGGFESETIPLVTGVDILELYFTLVTEGKNNFSPENIQEKAKLGSIFFMFTKPGVARRISVPKDFHVHNGRLFIKDGDHLGNVENATSRIGCFAYYCQEPNDYYRFIKNYDEQLGVFDDKGSDLLVHDVWE